MSPSIIKNAHHRELLTLIVRNSGKPTQHTFQDDYMGNTNMRYPISMPVLRRVAGAWMKEHKALDVKNFFALLTSLVKGESSTEKLTAGVLLDYATKEQRRVDPALVEQWLDHLTGWVEVDTLCTARYTVTEIPERWSDWKKTLQRLAASTNINKRRASLVLLCAPMRHVADDRLAAMALANVDRLKAEKEILITKAISWILRNVLKHHRAMVAAYLEENRDTLPKIAVRETTAKLKTGRKN